MINNINQKLIAKFEKSSKNNVEDASHLCIPNSDQFMFIFRLLLQFYANIQLNHMHNELQRNENVFEVQRSAKTPDVITFGIDFGQDYKIQSTLTKLQVNPLQLRSCLFKLKLSKPLPILD